MCVCVHVCACVCMCVSVLKPLHLGSKQTSNVPLIHATDLPLLLFPLSPLPLHLSCPPHLQSFAIEGDATSASYALAMAALTHGSVTVNGVGSASLQGDAKFCFALEKMGCTVEQTETSTRVELPLSQTLTPVDLDMGDITDTFMTAAVVLRFLS